jgi:hypothetical protein
MSSEKRKKLTTPYLPHTQACEKTKKQFSLNHSNLEIASLCPKHHEVQGFARNDKRIFSIAIARSLSSEKISQ